MTSDDESLRMDVGRANGGRTFVRVVHLPTGKDRRQVGLNGKTVSEVGRQLAEELLRELGLFSGSDENKDKLSNEDVT